MLRGLRGPLNDGSRGWRGLHGCACEDGSRASWRGGGYSAGKSACSFGYSKNGWYGGPTFQQFFEQVDASCSCVSSAA